MKLREKIGQLRERAGRYCEVARESWVVVGGSMAELGSWQREAAGALERSDAFLPELRNQNLQFSHPVLT